MSLLDIAAAAGLTLADVRSVAGSKSQIVAAFLREIDDKVLAQVKGPTEGQAARDTLFEVVMSRFDALAPHKAAVKSIAAAGRWDVSLAGPFLNSQRWMLTAAGIDADGVSGLVRTAGLGSLYVRVFDTWLGEDDPGIARTMAALDRGLRSGERTLSNDRGGDRRRRAHRPRSAGGSPRGLRAPVSRRHAAAAAGLALLPPDASARKPGAALRVDHGTSPIVIPAKATPTRG